MVLQFSPLHAIQESSRGRIWRDTVPAGRTSQQPAPSLSAKLAKGLRRDSKDCKIVYSTHSHYLIDTKNLSAAYIVWNAAINYGDETMAATRRDETRRDTNIQVTPYRQFAAAYHDQRDHFRSIFGAIDYVPSDLELTDDIVGLEGKNDFYTFKLIAGNQGRKRNQILP